MKTAERLAHMAPLQAPASNAAPALKRIDLLSTTGRRLKITKPLSVHLPRPSRSSTVGLGPITAW